MFLRWRDGTKISDMEVVDCGGGWLLEPWKCVHLPKGNVTNGKWTGGP